MHTMRPMLMLMLLLTMMQLLMVVRLQRMLMLRPSQIGIMHRPMLLMEELQIRPSGSITRCNLLRVSGERQRPVMNGSHEPFFLLDRWLTIAGNEHLTKPPLFDEAVAAQSPTLILSSQ
jgi:hypothetical protein